MKYRTILLLLIFCLAAALPGETAAAHAPMTGPAQDNEPVTVNSARLVTDVVGEKNAYLATVSPDGNYIAWGKQSGRGRNRVSHLCVFTFATAGKVCTDLSTDVYKGYPYLLQWSPDSRYIAFSENPLQLGYESDLWLYDTEAAAFANLTDDGLVGGWSAMPSQGEQPLLDLLPMWRPDSSLIYFWRVVPLGNMRYTVGLYTIAPDGGEPQLLRDLTAQFAAQLPLFDYQAVFMDGPSAISPDGSTIAALMTSVNDMGSWQQNLWTISVDDPKAAPQSLATPVDFASALPEWAQDVPPQAQGLSWTGDSDGVVVVVNSPVSTMTPVQVYYYVDAQGNGITPVVDFTSITDMDAYGDPAPGSDLPWRAYSPWTGSLSPEGDTLLMVQDLGGSVALLAAPLPPTGDLPSVAASADESPATGVANSSRGDGGKVIAWGLLLDIAEP